MPSRMVCPPGETGEDVAEQVKPSTSYISFPILSSFNERSSSASLSTRELYAIHGNQSVFAQVRRIQA